MAGENVVMVEIEVLNKIISDRNMAREEAKDARKYARKYWRPEMDKLTCRLALTEAGRNDLSRKLSETRAALEKTDVCLRKANVEIRQLRKERDELSAGGLSTTLEHYKMLARERDEALEETKGLINEAREELEKMRLDLIRMGNERDKLQAEAATLRKGMAFLMGLKKMPVFVWPG